MGVAEEREKARAQKKQAWDDTKWGQKAKQSKWFERKKEWKENMEQEAIKCQQYTEEAAMKDGVGWADTTWWTAERGRPPRTVVIGRGWKPCSEHWSIQLVFNFRETPFGYSQQSS